MQFLILMRLNNIVPIMIMLWPILWVISITSNEKSGAIYIVFTAGAIITRTIGCIFNDIADINFDKYVARTQHRPLTAKSISVNQALCLNLILISVALLLVIYLNFINIVLSLVALILILTYPFSKRCFIMPQLVLGYTFNMGIIMCYAAVLNTVNLNSWLIYFSVIAWTVSYDTIYGLADKKDDLKLGLKSSTITFDKNVIQLISVSQIIMLSLLSIFGIINSFSKFFYFTLVICAVHFCVQNILLMKKKCKHTNNIFLSNNHIGLIIFIGIYLQN